MQEEITDLLGWPEVPTKDDVEKEASKQREAIKGMEDQIKKAEEKQIDERFRMAVSGTSFGKAMEEKPKEIQPAEEEKKQPDTNELVQSLRNDL